MTIQIHRFDVLDSTNEKAKELCQLGAPSGTRVVAQEQRQGRGRNGRSWFSPHHDNLYLSYIHRSALDADKLAGMTLNAAVAIAEALVTLGFDPELKWPNDILLNGRKVGGILCELVTNDQGFTVIVGVGLNVNGQDFPPELQTIASSLFLVSNDLLDVRTLEERIAANLKDKLGRYERHGQPDIALYERYYRMMGRKVRFSTGAIGTAKGLSSDGGLEVETDQGTVVVRSGEVQLV